MASASDIVGLAKGIITTCQYVQGIRHAKKERADLAKELSLLESSLEHQLHNEVWMAMSRTEQHELEEMFDLLKPKLEELLDQLKTCAGTLAWAENIWTRASWPSQKSDIINALGDINRLNGYILQLSVRRGESRDILRDNHAILRDSGMCFFEVLHATVLLQR